VQPTGTTVRGHLTFISAKSCHARIVGPVSRRLHVPWGGSLYIGRPCGASAYIALMALFGIAPAVMRPTALALNILVASFTSFRYLSAGLFRWRTLWPFLIGALPSAFIGGAIQLPGQFIRPLVGVILITAGVRFLWPKELSTNRDPQNPPVIAGIPFGALIGFLSGLTGTGSGIFLSPILLFGGWSDTRTASGVAAVLFFATRLRASWATSLS
jgi:uncharacterized membrane protein YfcA